MFYFYNLGSSIERTAISEQLKMPSWENQNGLQVIYVPT